MDIVLDSVATATDMLARIQDVIVMAERFAPGTMANDTALADGRQALIDIAAFFDVDLPKCEVEAL